MATAMQRISKSDSDLTKNLFIYYILGNAVRRSGTRRSLTNGVYFQSPNTSIGKGYSGDGIPDTFFQFVSTYPFLDEQHKAFFRSQIDYLGNNMRFDNCIPWGGCRLNIPYYHLSNSYNIILVATPTFKLSQFSFIFTYTNLSQSSLIFALIPFPSLPIIIAYFSSFEAFFISIPLVTSVPQILYPFSFKNGIYSSKFMRLILRWKFIP